ncbi:MAG: Slp family lipoprotein [candidate division NC10 bacterium]|nr:Slp family lipoprotein [candidate division NC10 bacterium]
MAYRPAQFRRGALLVSLLVLLSSCASTFPRALMEQVDPTVSFAQLLRTPDAYQGRLVLVGGELLRTIRGYGAMELEILQRPLSATALPRFFQPSQGRFLVRVPAHLQRPLPEVGGLLTVIGEVWGAKERGGEVLPYLEARDLKAWPSWAALPPPQFSGVGD